MNVPFENQVAPVTGAGLGLTTTSAFTEAGAPVARELPQATTN
jgi:hypothetical protein